MRELQYRQKFKNRLYSTPALLGLFVLTLVLIKGASNVFIKERETDKGLTQLEEKMVALSNQEIDLKTEIKKLETRPGIDEAIKEKFNVSAPGEHVAIILNQSASTNTESTTTTSWYQRAWNAIITAQ